MSEQELRQALNTLVESIRATIEAYEKKTEEYREKDNVLWCGYYSGADFAATVCLKQLLTILDRVA